MVTDNPDVSDGLKAQQKKWVVILLLISCIAAFLLHVTYSPQALDQFRHSAEIDSLITLNFDRFNISSSQVRTRTIVLDTTSARKVYTVRVPPGFSKTQWHYELDKLMQPYRSATPARVIFPDQHLRIHVTYGTNVVRTIQLQTDPDLRLYRDFASLIIIFDRPPSGAILNQIQALGEPIHIAIRSQSPRTEFENIRNLRREYPYVVWGLQKNNGQPFDQLSDMDPFLNRINLVEQLDPGARILFSNPFEEITESFRQNTGRLNVMLIDISEAITIRDLSDSPQVTRTKQELSERSSLRWPPMVIVEGTNANIQRLQQFVEELKQDHVQLRSPYSMDF
jgi:hypothetical protein